MSGMTGACPSRSSIALPHRHQSCPGLISREKKNRLEKGKNVDIILYIYIVYTCSPLEVHNEPSSQIRYLPRVRCTAHTLIGLLFLSPVRIFIVRLLTDQFITRGTMTRYARTSHIPFTANPGAKKRASRLGQPGRMCQNRASNGPQEGRGDSVASATSPAESIRRFFRGTVTGIHPPEVIWGAGWFLSSP